MSTWYGFGPQFWGGQGGVMSRQEDERLIRNDLLQLLLTAPTERVMRVQFGTDIRRFVFENMSSNALDELRNNIISAIQTYEPRVNVTEVRLTPDDENMLSIEIYGYFNSINSLSNTSASLLVEFSVPLNTG